MCSSGSSGWTPCERPAGQASDSQSRAGSREAHGGTLRVESSNSSGTVFAASLPAERAGGIGGASKTRPYIVRGDISTCL